MKFSMFVMVALVSIGLGFSSAPAEAKRLGGGMSFGKSYNYNRTAKPVQKPSQQQGAPAAGQAASAGGRGFLGPLAGLAAGGLLAAMFFGGAFEGIQLMDILLFAGIAYLLFTFMRKRATPAPATASAGAGQWQREEPSEDSRILRREPVAKQSGGGFSIPDIGSGLKGEPLAVNPEWFNEAEFMAETNNHFKTLQAHWDRGDMISIAGYTTPEMLANLQRERAALINEPHTEVVSLDSQLLDLIQDGDKIVAAIQFSGLINEDHSPEPTKFAEIWHVEHPADSAEGDWNLAGIIQHH